MKKLVLALLAAMALMPAFAKHTLSLNLEKGATYYQNFAVDLTMNQEIMGQKIDVKMNIESRLSYNVKEKNSSGYLMDVTYEKNAMTMTSPMGEMKFSSENATESDVMSTLLKEMTLHSFQVQMNNNGTIKEIKNSDTFFEKLEQKVANLPEAQKAQILNQLKQSFGPKALKGNLEQMTAIFPDKKVNINDTWQNTIDLESGMSLTVQNTFTLTEYSKEAAKVTVSSTMKTVENAAPSDINGMKGHYDITGAVVSVLSINPVTGWIIEGKINQDMEGQVNIEANAQLPDGLQFPMKISSVSNVTN